MSRVIQYIAFASLFAVLSACGTSDTDPMAGAPLDGGSGPVPSAAGGAGGVGGGDGPVKASAELVRTNCSPIAATSDGTLMAFNIRGPSGLFDAYVGGVNCQGDPLLPPYDGHRGAADISPDGRHVLLVIARGWDKATAGAEPGKGSSNSIDLFDRDTGTLTTLVPSFCTGCQRGALWPRLSPDGSQIAWAELVQTPLEVQPIGRWRLHVSALNADRTAIVSERTWEPRSSGSVLVEPYGWLPGTADLIFATNDGVTNCSLTSCLQLFRIADALPDVAATLISAPVNGANAYHEFAHFRGDGWIYTSIGRESQGADLWRMKPDGSDRQRLTYFGGAWSLAQLAFAQMAGFPEPQYTIVGGMATVPGGFIAGVIHENNAAAIDAWRIDIVPAGP